jgi:hypothetical protein
MIQCFTSSQVLFVRVNFATGSRETIAELLSIWHLDSCLRFWGQVSGCWSERLGRGRRGIVGHAVDDCFSKTLDSIDGFLGLDHLFADPSIGMGERHGAGGGYSTANGHIYCQPNST